MIDENMVLYRDDMEKDIKIYQIRLDNIFHDIIHQGNKFFDDNISILHLNLLLNQEEFKKKFMAEVLVEIEKPIDDIIHEVSDLIFKRSKKQNNFIVSHLGDRPSKLYSINLHGEVSQSAVDSIAQDMLAKIRRNTTMLLGNYNRETSTASMIANVRRSVISMGILEGSAAATLGSLVTLSMLDITGVIASSCLAGVGLFMLPLKKTAVK